MYKFIKSCWILLTVGDRRRWILTHWAYKNHISCPWEIRVMEPLIYDPQSWVSIQIGCFLWLENSQMDCTQVASIVFYVLIQWKKNSCKTKNWLISHYPKNDRSSKSKVCSSWLYKSWQTKILCPYLSKKTTKRATYMLGRIFFFHLLPLTPEQL